MFKKLILATCFTVSASCFYLVEAAWACTSYSTCKIQCFNSGGVEVDYSLCGDNGYSCECFTEPSNNGYAYSHAHCTVHTGRDTFCNELL